MRCLRKLRSGIAVYVLGRSANRSPGGLSMSHKMTTQKLVSMSVAALTGAMLCALFTMVLFVTGALAA